MAAEIHRCGAWMKDRLHSLSAKNANTVGTCRDSPIWDLKLPDRRGFREAGQPGKKCRVLKIFSSATAVLVLVPVVGPAVAIACIGPAMPSRYFSPSCTGAGDWALSQSESLSTPRCRRLNESPAPLEVKLDQPNSSLPSTITFIKIQESHP